MPSQPLRIAVITISDRTAAGLREDLSGPLATRMLSEYGAVSGPIVVADGVESVREMIGHAIFCGAQVVFTTGGTGITSRDLTPEATEPLITQRMWGIEQRMRDNPKVPTAAISRGIAGIANIEGKRAFVVNAPGSSGGVKDAVEAVGPLLAHIVDQMEDGDHPAPERREP
ncbi:MogA/MoaB family molybdenum cofactor biosynthesis protein [Actinomycetaceae bacterium L2_0104]